MNTQDTTMKISQAVSCCYFGIFSQLLTGFLVPLSQNTVSAKRQQKESVSVDLRTGHVKGSSRYISFLESPRVTSKPRCDSQAVLKVDLSGPFKAARFILKYDRPRLWTFHVSDAFSDGYGGGNGTRNTAEAHVINRQMRIYSNQLEGFHDATINGGLLLKVVDNVIKPDSNLVIQVSDQKIAWSNDEKAKQYIESKYLFSVTKQNDKANHSDSIVFAGLNRVVADNYRKGSGLCQATVTLLREKKVDHCRSPKYKCHKDAYCNNTRKSISCRCKPGFYGSGIICKDENECEHLEYDNGGCAQTCENTAGSYHCTCTSGFELASDGHNCLDRNECASDHTGCQYRCENTYGSYRCTCPSGQTLAEDGVSCKSGTCGSHLGCAHHCASDSRGTSCQCRAGYRLHDNGRDCSPEICGSSNGGCHHVCTDTEQGVACSCHRHYVLNQDKATCTETCKVRNGGCDKGCNDTASGPECSCPEGFVLDTDKKTCLDIDECLGRTASCSHSCVNTLGSYECVCPSGFKVAEDRTSCVDLDECTVNTTCDHLCLNTQGSFQCQCYEGYKTHGITHCADDDECAVNNGGCGHRCENAEGGYICSCNQGYHLHSNRKDCLPATSCLPLPPLRKVVKNCRVSGGLTSCQLTCADHAQSTLHEVTSMTTDCGQSTGFQWSHVTSGKPLLSCSNEVQSPGYRRNVMVLFLLEECSQHGQIVQDFKNDFVSLVSGLDSFNCGGQCKITNVDLVCGSRRRKFERQAKSSEKENIQVHFEMHVQAQSITKRCDLSCARRKTFVKMKKSLKAMRKSMKGGWIEIRYKDAMIPLVKDSLKALDSSEECALGYMLVDNKCVACSVGTYFDISQGVCQDCMAGSYQTEEGHLSCVPCSHNKQGVGLPGATQQQDCDAQCEPGHFSPSGLKPCQLCARGRYQPEYGRMGCQECGSGLTTTRVGATGFQDCNAKSRCPAGQFYKKGMSQCEVCPRGEYQPRPGQDYCHKCPGETMTDSTGATNSSFCKDRSCGEWHGENQGFIQTPNWPGNYPTNISCTWSIKPPKGRRILVVIPEIDLAAKDKCADVLIMRKSASKYSLLTHETCEPAETPLAFTARSKKLWIHFKSNGENTAKGFSIPYVMYDDEYQDLIEDIVRDGRLYSVYQHQEVLKNRKLLSSLLEVIAEPLKYFSYANISDKIFPESFIRLLRKKVVEFFLP